MIIPQTLVMVVTSSFRARKHFWVRIFPFQSSAFLISLPSIGRGPLLKIDATSISRKHARLSSSEGAGVLLTCIHRNCIYVKQKSKASWEELQEGKSVSLEDGDEFRFLQDKFHFKLTQLAISRKSTDNRTEEEKLNTRLPETPTKCEKDNEDSVQTSEVVITPKPTGEIRS